MLQVHVLSPKPISETSIRIAYSIPRQPTRKDRLDDKIFEIVQEAVSIGVSPEEFYESVMCAWREEIRGLQNDVERAHKRFYLRYQVPEKT